MYNARAAAQPTHTFQNPLTLIAIPIQLIIAHFHCRIELSSLALKRALKRLW